MQCTKRGVYLQQWLGMTVIKDWSVACCKLAESVLLYVFKIALPAFLLLLLEERDASLSVLAAITDVVL